MRRCCTGALLRAYYSKDCLKAGSRISDNKVVAHSPVARSQIRGFCGFVVSPCLRRLAEGSLVL